MLFMISIVALQFASIFVYAHYTVGPLTKILKQQKKRGSSQKTRFSITDFASLTVLVMIPLSVVSALAGGSIGNLAFGEAFGILLVALSFGLFFWLIGLNVMNQLRIFQSGPRFAFTTLVFPFAMLGGIAFLPTTTYAVGKLIAGERLIPNALTLLGFLMFTLALNRTCKWIATHSEIAP